MKFGWGEGIKEGFEVEGRGKRTRKRKKKKNGLVGLVGFPFLTIKDDAFFFRSTPNSHKNV